MRISLSRMLFLCLCIMIGMGLILLTQTPMESAEAKIYRFITCMLFIFCIIQGAKEKSLANPFFLFSITPLSLMLYTEKVSSYYLSSLKVGTWEIAVINILCYIIGLEMGRKKYGEKDFVPLKVHTCLQQPSIIDTVILFLLGNLPWVFRKVGIHTPFDSIMELLIYPSLFLAIGTKKKMVITLLFGIQLLFIITGGGINKTGALFLIMTIITGIESYLVISKRNRKKLIILIVLFAVIFIFIIFPLKDYIEKNNSFEGFLSSNWGDTAEYYSDRVSLSISNVFLMPYMYLVSSWNNLQYVMETQGNSTYGLWSLKPILGYLQIDGLFTDQYYLDAANSFNTFTYITYLYKDFGRYISGVMSLLLGMFSAYAFYSKYNSEMALNKCVYPLIACAIAEMFFSNHFFTQSYPFTIIILLAIYKLARKMVGHKTTRMHI